MILSSLWWDAVPMKPAPGQRWVADLEPADDCATDELEDQPAQRSNRPGLDQ